MNDYEWVDEIETTPPQGSLKSLAIKPSSDFARNVARQGFNLTTRVRGTPGDILSIINEFAARPLTKAITGEETSPYEKTSMGKLFPSTEMVREKLTKGPGEFFKPRGEVEKFADDLIEDTAMLFNPFQKVSKVGRVLSNIEKIGHGFLKSLGVNVAKEGVKSFSGSEKAGDWTKIGAIFFLSMLDKPFASKQISKLYASAENAIPKGALSNAQKMESNLSNLKNKVLADRPVSSLAPSGKFVVDEIDKVLPQIRDGKIDVKTAWALKRDLNENLGAAYKAIDKKDLSRTRTLASQVVNELNDSLRNYGKVNPEFGKMFSNAEEGFSAIKKSNWTMNFIEKHMKYHPVTNGLLHAFGSTAGGLISPLAGLPTAGGTAATFAGYHAAKIGYRIAKSPTIAKIYKKTVTAALKENSVLMNKYLKELDEKLQEEESKDTYEFID